MDYVNIMKLLRRKPHKTSHESYKHVIGDNGEDIQEYSSKSSYIKTFARDKWDSFGNYLDRVNSAHGTNNDNMKINGEIMKTDFRNKNYLKGIKHAFIVPKKAREQFKNGTYGN